MTNIINFNTRHNKLTFVNYSDGRTSDKRILGVFTCDCGREVRLPVGRVVTGYIKNCNSLAHRPKPNLTHGMRNTVEYSIWRGIKNRIFNPKSKDYSRYGVKVGMSDALASDFVAFYKELGERPSAKHQVDRIDNNKGYIEGNLRWASPKENSRNRSNNSKVHVRGINYGSIAEAAEHHSVSSMTIIRWCKGSYDTRRGTYTPPRKDCYYV